MATTKRLTPEAFSRVKLRTAQVVAAVAHPRADKLLVLKIRLGKEERQIVAGIRGHYTPEELIGKTIIVVANLEPASLRGVESQGMLLAVRRGDGKLALLIPDRPCASGLSVS